MRAVIISVLTLGATLPIWLILLYKILLAVNASELMWFLYFTYIPAVVVVHLISALSQGKGVIVNENRSLSSCAR